MRVKFWSEITMETDNLEKYSPRWEDNIKMDLGEI
jgi:hypothetical protein